MVMVKGDFLKHIGVETKWIKRGKYTLLAAMEDQALD